MRCKGCAAKVSPQVLQKVLKSLQDTSSQSNAEQTKEDQQETVLAGQLDDAVVLQAPEAGTVSVQTVDFMNSFVDDPFVFGGIVAVHAMSDCFAMGADPAVALAVVQVLFQCTSGEQRFYLYDGRDHADKAQFSTFVLKEQCPLNGNPVCWFLQA